MDLISSECVILKQQSLREGDVLVTFLARDRGRMAGVVRGSRKITGRGVGSFEPFTLGVMHYTERVGGDLVSIRKCDPRPPYLFLQQNYGKIVLAGYFAELVSLCPISPSEAERFYLLLSGAIARLCEPGAADLDLLRIEFELDFLDALGVAPDFATCRVCGQALLRAEGGRLVPVQGGEHLFDPGLGGVRHAGCSAPGRNAAPLSAGTLAFVAAWRGQRPGSSTVKPTRLALQELGHAVTRYVVHQLEREPRSLALLADL
ncbi:MAG: DNA repair protein RecO [SAR324 cluster bacterium]